LAFYAGLSDITIDYFELTYGFAPISTM